MDPVLVQFGKAWITRDKRGEVKAGRDATVAYNRDDAELAEWARAVLFVLDSLPQALTPAPPP